MEYLNLEIKQFWIFATI